MSFYDDVERVKLLLRKQGRLSLVGLARELGDMSRVMEIVHELVSIQAIAVRDGDTIRENLSVQELSLPEQPDERRRISVLNADVHSHMDFSDTREREEEYFESLREFLGIAREVAEQLGAKTDHTGDGFIAHFGLRKPIENHALLACTAARRILEELSDPARHSRKNRIGQLPVRMGIHSGDAIIGEIAPGMSNALSSVGQPPDIATRIQANATPNTCLISAYTEKLVRGHVKTTDMGEFKLKGVADPVQLFRLDDINMNRTGFDVRRQGGLSKFAGREGELALMRGALAAAKNTSGAVIGISAEPGVGKSRLCFEFLRNCGGNDVQIFEARALPHSVGTPFFVVREILAAYLGLPDKTDRSSIEDRLRRITDGSIGPPAIALIQELLATASPQERLIDSQYENSVATAADAIRTILGAHLQSGPVVTLIEDLHWIDQASGEVLCALFSLRPSQRSLLLLTHRPEFTPPWRHFEWYHPLALSNLSRPQAIELFCSLLGPGEPIRSLADTVFSATNGNAFYVEEVVRNLIEVGHIVRVNDHYSLTSSIENISIPPSVTDVLSARMGRLPAAVKATMQLAAVIGREFSLQVLADTRSMSESEVLEHLDALQRARFVEQVQFAPTRKYVFTHSFTRETALQLLLVKNVQNMHRAVAKSLEKWAPEDPALRAYHWEQGGALNEAAHCHAEAAERVGYGDLTVAGFHWRRVETLLSSMPSELATWELGVRVHLKLLNIGWRSGANVSDSESGLSKGQAFARLAGNPTASLALRLVFDRVLAAAGDIDRHLVAATEDFELAQSCSDRWLRATASANLAEAFGYLSRFDEAIALLDRALLDVPTHGNQIDWLIGINPYTILSFWRGRCLAWLARLPEAVAQFERSCVSSESDGSIDQLVFSLFYSAQAYYLMGDAISAAQVSHRIRQACKLAGDPPMLVVRAQGAEVFSLLADRRYGEAVRMADAAVQGHGSIHRVLSGPMSVFYAEGLLGSKRFDEAIEVAMNAVDLCRPAKRRQYEALALGVLARTHLRRGGQEAISVATSAVNAAEEIVNSSRIHTLKPFVAAWRARIAQAKGDIASMHNFQRLAVEGFDGIGATQRAHALKRVMAEEA